MQCSETFTALPAFLHVVLKSSQLATDPSIFTVPATKEFIFLFKTSTRTLKLPAINLLKQKENRKVELYFELHTNCACGSNMTLTKSEKVVDIAISISYGHILEF